MTILKKWFSRKTAKRALFAMATVFGTIFILEWIIVLLLPGGEDLYEYDPDLGFRVQPGAMHSNRFGFNDRDYAVKKDPRHFRVVFVGDSFAWSQGREGNFTTLLESKLERHFGEHRVDIINSGYPMTHTGEQLVMLQKFGMTYHPDMVVLGFFAGNDVLEAEPNRKRIVVNNIYVDVDRRLSFTVFGKPMFPGALFYAYLKKALVLGNEAIQHKWERNAEEGHAGQQADSAPTEKATFSRRAYFQISGKRLLAFHRELHEDGYYQDHLDFVYRSLSNMKQLCDERDCLFRAFIIPDEFQVDDRFREELLAFHGRNPEDYDLRLVQNLITHHLQSEKTTCLDMLDAFREARKQKRLYEVHDSHWDQDGNALAADLLFHWLLPVIEEKLKTNNP